eukprot:scaffold279408_cov36-Tisochrysis_lutea.AAC.1
MADSTTVVAGNNVDTAPAATPAATPAAASASECALRHLVPHCTAVEARGGASAPPCRTDSARLLRALGRLVSGLPARIARDGTGALCRLLRRDDLLERLVHRPARDESRRASPARAAARDGETGRTKKFIGSRSSNGDGTCTWTLDTRCT